ncbi:NAD(P)H-dependent oxidoreductase [Roseimarinus sediminis]|uniref:NAD(P)H-dependent oxidoreductase n=1 Tax=Roseimarinus sediminis TaxID=1610899 RepID=UPI003D202879
MKLTIFNGSPRGTKSNSTLLIEQFLKGYHDYANNNTPVHYLAATAKTEEHLRAIKAADFVLIIFPLYTDAMPGQVKLFFESLEPLHLKDKKIGFIVQSGFPEAYHSIFVKQYLEKLRHRLGCQYLGTVIRGGIEGIQVMPPWMTRKVYRSFLELGHCFALNGAFNTDLVEKLAKPYRMSAARKFGYRLMLKTGLANQYWDQQLKKNKVYEQRFAQPYA